MSTPDPDQKCLQCGETRAVVKANGYICGIMGGGEYNELVEDWPTHRWADWNDKALASAGIKSEAFHKYRRADIRSLEWADCDDQVRGHILATKESDREWYGARIGQCITCHHAPEEGDMSEHNPCCSSHGIPMTCERYRRTHFVEVRPCCSKDAQRLKDEAVTQ